MSHRPPPDRDEQARQASRKLAAHRDHATWGERLVPLGRFRNATAAAGQRLPDEARQRALADFARRPPDPTPVEGPFNRIVAFGGVYNNHRSLAALLGETAVEAADAVYCLGDFGGFGPSPEKVWPLLEAGGVLSVAGNYELSLSSGREDCNCGYTDPRDTAFARLSYDHTAVNTSAAFKGYMGELPTRRRLRLGDRELLLVHGSPRQVNEFLFHSTSPVPFLERLLDEERCDGLLCTHTGLPWHRRLPSGRDVVNVGVIGRPANDGRTEVWYATLEAREEGLAIAHRPLPYDHPALATEMRQQRLPEEFVETIETGWWTTCLEILPAKERSLSRW